MQGSSSAGVLTAESTGAETCSPDPISRESRNGHNIRLKKGRGDLLQDLALPMSLALGVVLELAGLYMCDELIPIYILLPPSQIINHSKNFGESKYFHV